MNHFHRLLLAFCLLPNLQIAAQSNVTHTIMQGNVQRSFIVHLPTGYNPSIPISCVFNLHGSGMTPSYQQLYTKMDVVSNANNFMVVYPAGINSTWEVGSVGAYDQNASDVDFIAAVLDTLEELYNINTERVFACGLSQGGYMSHRLACDLQDRFAAVASVAGSIADSVQFHCDNSRNVPTLFIHGVDDPYVSYAWAQDGIAFWTSRNMCGAAASVTVLPNSNTTDGSTVEHHVYGNCVNDAAVEMFRVIGGGHTWPGPFLNLSGYGNTNYDISGSAEIWKFFNRFSIHGSVVGIAETEKEELKVFPNPAMDEINISSVSGTFEIQVFDPKGMLVLEAHHVEKLDISGLLKGFYYLQGKNETRTIVQKFIKE